MALSIVRYRNYLVGVRVVKVQAGRWTDQHDGPVVVFLIGMTVNSWWRVHRWLPVASAMPRMLRELATNPTSGLLGWSTTLGVRGPLVVQYWASSEQLMAYAQDPKGEHRPAWSAYNAMVRKAGLVVGVWHETYVVPAGSHETIYVGTHSLGLGDAVGRTPVSPRGETARQRLASAEPLSPPAGAPQ